MSQPKRGPGRPRDSSLDSTVLDSVLDVIEDHGLGGLNMDTVANRAGVSKATIYRRWDSKEELLVDAVACLADSVMIDVTGDIRQDLTTLVTQMRSFMHEMPAGSVFPWLVGEVAAGTDLGKRYLNDVIAPRRAAVAHVIREAVERGDLRSDIDVELAVDMLLGPVLVRKLVGPSPHRSWPETLVDELLDGWRP
ncbi:MAG: TetR/AcrR family transcriptional regulator [Acidimicrobiia bacterium]